MAQETRSVAADKISPKAGLRMRDTPYTGRRYPRVEDWALLRGTGRFVDDLRPQGVLEAAFLRSSTAHGLIRFD